MPVWNGEATLQAAIDSILQQTEPGWELLAVDDGSTDATGVMLAAAARRDPRVRPVTTAHQGIVAALETGLARATAPLVARMDADDVSHPERLARQRAHLADHPEVGLVASRVAFGGDVRAGAGFARHVAWTNTLLTHEEIAAARFVESPLAHPSVMFRRALVDRLGGYAAGDFPEDYELWLRWLEGGVRMEKRPEILLAWNDPPARLSRTDRRCGPGAIYRLKARYLGRWLARHNPHHPTVLVWGAGRVTRRRALDLEAQGVHIAAWVDVDPAKVGRRLGGCPVLAPAEIPPPGRCFVLTYVASHGAREEIAAFLRARGHAPGLHYLCAA